MKNPYETPKTQGQSDFAERSKNSPKHLKELLTLFAIIGAIAPFPLMVWSGETEPFFGPFNLAHAAISWIGGFLGVAWICWYAYICFAVFWGWFRKGALFFGFIALVFGGLSLLVLYFYLEDRNSWKSRQERKNPWSQLQLKCPQETPDNLECTVARSGMPRSARFFWRDCIRT